jgi:hypothetical protein
MLTRDERNQCIKFQDAIGAIVDLYLAEGMHPDRIQEVLRDEANATPSRFHELEGDRAAADGSKSLKCGGA